MPWTAPATLNHRVGHEAWPAPSPADRLVPPFWLERGSVDHPLGTDNLGRDVLSCIIYRSRLSLAGGLGITFPGIAIALTPISPPPPMPLPYRCPIVQDRCRTEEPPLELKGEGRVAACWHRCPRS